MVESDFAERLKALREAAGLTQEALAEKSGLTRVAIARLETGRRAPAWESVLALCDALAVSCEQFRMAKPRGVLEQRFQKHALPKTAYDALCRDLKGLGASEPSGQVKSRPKTKLVDVVGFTVRFDAEIRGRMAAPKAWEKIIERCAEDGFRPEPT